MTGPEHYLMAEELLDRAEDAPVSGNFHASYVKCAHVHAVLALAAATASNRPSDAGTDEDWMEALAS